MHLRIEEEARKQDMKEEVMVISNANKKPHSKNHAAVVFKPNSKNLKNATKNRSSNKNPMKVHNTYRNNTRKLPPQEMKQLSHLCAITVTNLDILLATVATNEEFLFKPTSLRVKSSQ